MGVGRAVSVYFRVYINCLNHFTYGNLGIIIVHGIDSFFKDFKTPPDGIRLMVDQLASSRMIDANLAQKTPLTAYYENRYVEELEREGFFKKLWQ